jgi:hypothetical protein
MRFFTLAKQDAAFMSISLFDSNEMDTSDFIITLTYVVMKQQLKNPFSPFLLEEAMQYYLLNDYEKAFSKLAQIVFLDSGFKYCAITKEQVRTKLADTFIKDDPTLNLSRRYFETQLANKVWVDSMPGSLHGFECIRVFMQEINERELGGGRNSVNLPPRIESETDVKSLLVGMRDLVDRTAFLDRESCELKASITIYKSKTRERKPTLGPQVSSNPGILKATHPVPLDDLVEEEQNKVVDMFTVAFSVVLAKRWVEPLHFSPVSGGGSYAQARPTVPFVNSISGTMRDIVVLISKFIEARIDSFSKQTLQSVADDILKVYLAFAVKSGFHSMGELLDILREPQVRDLSAQHGIVYRVELDTELIKNVVVKSADYVDVMVRRKMLLTEIESREQQCVGDIDEMTADPKPMTFNSS